MQETPTLSLGADVALCYPPPLLLVIVRLMVFP